MLIGFSSGCFYKLFSRFEGRLSIKSMNCCKLGNIIELNCSNEKLIDFLIEKNDIDLNYFDFVSLHAPCLNYCDDEKSNNILTKINFLVDKFDLQNVIVHPTKKIEFEIFKKYKKIPISIENMDLRKKEGKSLKEIKKIINKYNFNLTLDLQHCFTNDKTMSLAFDIQKELKNKIVEYHISAYDDKINHYSLFKTKQEVIVDSLEYKDKPIIIESTFYKKEEPQKEFNYLKNKIFVDK